MNLHKFRVLLARAVLLPLVLAILLAAVLFWAVRSLNSAAAWVDHSDEVISQSNYLLKLIIDMETSLRGYVITGNEDFLQPYQQAAPVVPQRIAALNHLISDDTDQQRNLAQIDDSFEAWRRYSLNLIGKRHADPAEAQSLAVSYQGKEMMDTLRQQVADFVSVEEDLRQQRQRTSRRAVAILLPTIEGLTLILGLALAAFTRSTMLRLSSEFGDTLETAEKRAAALQESERRWATTLSSIGDGVIATDAEGKVTFINPVAQVLTGHASERALGRDLADVFPIVNETTRIRVEDPVEKVKRMRVVVGMANHTVLLRPDGTEIPIDDSGAPIFDDRGNMTGIVLVFRDVRDRRDAERLLALEQERYHALIGATAQSVWRADREGSRMWVSTKFSDLTGLSGDQTLGWGWLQAAHPEDRDRAEKAWRKAVSDGADYYIEWRVRLRDGSYRYCATRALPILNADKTVREWVGIVIDIDDSKRHQERLELAQQELEARVTLRTAQLSDATNSMRHLTGLLLRSQDEERRRIARELHDSVGQLLVALGMNYSRVAGEASRLSPDSISALKESGEIVTELTSQVRTISHLLHPPLLEEVGLEAALRWFVDGFSQRSGIQVSIEMPPSLRRLDTNLEIAVFRVMQECLTNIHRHSGSKTAGVRVVPEPESLRLEVRDNGVGIPPEKQKAINSTGLPGVGLRGMRERLREFGGSLEVSSDSTGTLVTALFPIGQTPPDVSTY
jgi:PAS domain S-box-containing protein